MKYNNPIIKGFNPDPSVCRVGEDYYLVTSTFEYFPAVPIYHSTDLVNWEHIGNCIERAEQLPLDGAQSSGGTGNGHHEIAARSRSIWGPYESCPENPILTNRNDTSKQISCSGHADLIDDKNGNWWLVHLGTRDIQGMTHLGRETFLMPVVWRDGWFYAGSDRKAHIDAEAVNGKNKRQLRLANLYGGKTA